MENDDEEDDDYDEEDIEEIVQNEANKLFPDDLLILGIDEDEPNKEEAIKKHRENCMYLFENILITPTDVDFANLFKPLFENIVVCVSIKPLTWYFYDKQLWNEDIKECHRRLIDEKYILSLLDIQNFVFWRENIVKMKLKLNFLKRDIQD